MVPWKGTSLLAMILLRAPLAVAKPRNGGDNMSMQDEEPIHHGRYLDYHIRNGWEFVSRSRSEEVVAIVALNSEEELILVEQYRVPVSARVLELPAGLVGDEEDHLKESPLQAAQRELLEETGYVSESWEEAFSGCSSAGLCDEFVRIFIARNARKEGPGGGVGTEKIQVHLVGLSGLDAFIDAQMSAGVKVDLKVRLARAARVLSE